MSPIAHGEVVAALLHSEPGTVIRIVRTARQWSQAELGRRCGYSASQVSRWGVRVGVRRHDRASLPADHCGGA